ncbi:MAG: HNH endonuclease [Chloroflexi bacterium]|nr:HNH endonuclease [Chloroflexota bacterium]
MADQASRDYVPRRLRARVAAQAQHRCEYCLTSQRVSGAQMQVDHVVPVSQGGTSDEANLSLACAWCNSFKSATTRAADRETGEGAQIFNPRTQVWTDHFRWSDDGTLIVGLTAVGRATVLALRLNNEFIVLARRLWVLAGWHPPTE